MLRALPEISASSWPSRRPDGKARGGRIAGLCNRRATQPAGMSRRSRMAQLFPDGPLLQPGLYPGSQFGRLTREELLDEGGLPRFLQQEAVVPVRSLGHVELDIFVKRPKRLGALLGSRRWI